MIVPPLDHVRVLDLTRLLPGPYCSQLLADFGAEVIKIEAPEEGDYARWYEPKLGNNGAMFTSLNRNKKSIVLNLKVEKDRATFLSLVETADVLIESFRPGVMKRLGADYETLKQLNSKLIYCAITGYGQTGPYKHKSGHDINFISYAGLMNFQGEKGSQPFVPATQVADINGGLLATVGILIALVHQQQSGEGQFVDISMTDGVISALQTIFPSFLAGDQVKQGELTLSGGKACYGVYETADKRYLSVGALELKFWKEFCKGINRLDFIPLLDANRSVQEQLKAEIAFIINKKTLAEWLNTFDNLDACVSPVLTLEEVIENPQIKHRDMILEIKDKENKTIPQIGIPIKMSKTPGKVRFQAPHIGEHTSEIKKTLEMERDK